MKLPSHRLCAATALGLLLAFLSVAAVAALEPYPATPRPRAAAADLYGDPLPSGALVRFGSMRLRHRTIMGLTAFSPDGRTLATLGWKAKLWDVATGRLLQEFEPHQMMDFGLAFSPDSKMLVTTQNVQVYLWDIATGKGRALWSDNNYEHTAMKVAISPDGKLLALGGTVRRYKDGGYSDHAITYLYDLNSLKKLADLESADGDWIWGLVFSPDNKQLATAARAGLELWDVPAGKRRLHVKSKLSFQGLVFAADGRSIAGHALDGQNALIQLPSGKVIVHPKIGDTIHGRVQFTSDGKELVIAGSYGPVVAVPATGQGPARELLPKSSHRRFTAIDHQGKQIATMSEDGVFEVLNLASGRPTCTFDDHRGGPVLEAIPSPDARRVATLTPTELGVWELSSGKLLRRIRGSEFIPGLRWTADGRTLSAADTKGISWWDAQTGKLLRRVKLPQRRWLRATVLPDGQRIVGRGQEDGKPERFYVLHAATGKDAHTVAADRGAADALSPDGKYYVSAYAEDKVRLRDAAENRLLWEVERSQTYANIGFAPDGRLIGIMGEKGLRVLETATGADVGGKLLPKDKYYMVEAINFSPDGRTVAVTFHPRHETVPRGGTGSVTHSASDVLLFEAATGRVRRRLPTVHGRLRCAFTTAGDYLVTGSSDGTGLVWEFYPRPNAQTKALTAQEARRLWDALGDLDSEKAFAAICALRASPPEAVALIGTRLQPVVRDAARIKRLLKDLDADQFNSRQAATKELVERAEEAEALVRLTLKADLSLEARRRLEGVLAQIEEQAAGPIGLQRLRAVEVLEHAGSPQARRLLERLAEGAEGARLSAAAKLAISRLGGR